MENSDAILAVRTKISVRPNGTKAWAKIATIECPNCGTIHERYYHTIKDNGRGVYCSIACKENCTPAGDRWYWDAFFEVYKKENWSNEKRQGVKVCGIKDSVADTYVEPVKIAGI